LNYFNKSTPKFEGREPSLKGHIYDHTGERNPDQFLKTTKEIRIYVGRTYTKYTADFTEAVESLELVDPVEPADPDPTNALEVKRWEIRIKEHHVKQQAYENFRSGLYSVVLGQCTEALEEQLKSHDDFEAANQNGIALLTIIRTILYSFEEKRKLVDGLADVKETFYSFKQGKYMPLQRYHELFLAHVKVLDEVGVTIADESLIKAVGRANGRPVNPNAVDRAAAKEMALAMRFIRGTNVTHAPYLKHLRNSYLDGNDIYPTTLHGAYNVLQRRETDDRPVVNESDGVAFAQSQSQGGGGERKLDHIECWNCGRRGHFKDNCTEPPREQEGQQGVQLAMYGAESDGFSFSQSGSSGVNIPKNWILLDNQSTVDIFSNSALLKNIRQVDRFMNIRCNAGTRCTNIMGELPGYGDVWYDKESIANILSFKRVQDKCQVTYDSMANVFVVEKPDGSRREFRMSPDGLFYLDTGAKEEDLQADAVCCMLETVAANKAKYSSADYSKAVLARKIQVTIGRPSTKEFIRIVNGNMLPDCPISRADILAAEHIFGPEVGSLKGKTTRRRPHAIGNEVTSIPPVIMERYRDVTISADLMYINGIAFLVTASRKIHFGTVEALNSRSTPTLSKAIGSVAAIYRRAGCRVTMALMDGEFEPLRDSLAELGIALNATSRDEHVGDIERYIRTLKERVRSTYNTLPFEIMPPRLVIEMAKSNHYGSKGQLPSALQVPVWTVRSVARAT
jgi:hypothetical protein